MYLKLDIIRRKHIIEEYVSFLNCTMFGSDPNGRVQVLVQEPPSPQYHIVCADETAYTLHKKNLKIFGGQQTFTRYYLSCV